MSGVLDDLTHVHAAQLLELSLWGMQAWSEHTGHLEPEQFEALILLTMDVKEKLEQVEAKESAEFNAQREAGSAPAPATPDPPAGPESQEPAKVRPLRPAQ